MTSDIRESAPVQIQRHYRAATTFLRRTKASPPSSTTIIWAVRRDWAIDGSHEFVCPRSNQRAAERQLAKDRAFWRRGPIRPALSLVQMSAHEFALHGKARRDCRAPDCALPPTESTTIADRC
jgi:hypothetical protein